MRDGLGCPVVDVVKVGHNLGEFGDKDPKIIGEAFPEGSVGVVQRHDGLILVTVTH